MNSRLKKIIAQLPVSPGVYLMKNSRGAIIYVGKASGLKRRVSSYFQKQHLDFKTSALVAEIADIEIRVTDSEIEALILEAELIRKLKPKYNIRTKDDKSFLYLWISREKFPRIATVRATDLHLIKEKKPRLFGPYTSAASLKIALDVVRRVIPYRSCRIMPKRACLYGRLGLCDAPCIDGIDKQNYARKISWLVDFFSGKKHKIIKSLNVAMQRAARQKEFEEAARLRDQINALRHIHDVALIGKEEKSSIYKRVEGYDISNMSGLWATGSMVVFEFGEPEKSEYRKFRIGGAEKRPRPAEASRMEHGRIARVEYRERRRVKPNDVAMLAEVLRRRLGHRDWPQPDLLVIDGGRPQLNSVLTVLRSLNLRVPMVGIAKGPDRKKDEFIFEGMVPERDFQLFKQVRDEAHRFARGYYRQLHRRSMGEGS